MQAQAMSDRGKTITHSHATFLNELHLARIYNNQDDIKLLSTHMPIPRKH